MLTKSPCNPEGTSPWKGPKKVAKVLAKGIEQDSAPQLQAAPTPLRRSARRIRGIPAQRYHDVYSCNRAFHVCGLHAGDG